MNLEDIKHINQMFAEFYPYLAGQIAGAYGREDGLALEIGPYSSLIKNVPLTPHQPNKKAALTPGQPFALHSPS